jgi:hypothetical protein
MALNNEARLRLLELLQNLGAGVADAHSHDPERQRRMLFPIPEHLRAIEPEVVLVIGDRGAGKSHLKDVLRDVGLRKTLTRYVPRTRMANEEADWVEAWPLGKEGPESGTWREFVTSHRERPEDISDLWLALLVRRLAPHLPGEAKVAALASIRATRPGELLDTFRATRADFIHILDSLDNRLEAERRWLVASYDELDTVSLDWASLGAVVSGLINLWVTFARRWQRLRPKIFMRTDFYRHNRGVSGADVAKLAANRVELSWSNRSLYGVLIKHVVNQDKALEKHFTGTVELRKDPELGLLPVLTKDEDARPFIERLAHRYMGANPKKGVTFSWLLDKLRDGNDRVVPRSLIQLIERAATEAIADTRATGSRLLEHVALRRALDVVSTDFVDAAARHEFPWIPSLKRRLAGDPQVPWTEREVARLIGRNFDGDWGSLPGAEGPEPIRPPGRDVAEVLENLVQLGLLTLRGDGSYNVPDLYLNGLGLKRKGGVARS